MSEFNKDHSRRDGLQNYCRACSTRLSRLSRRRHPKTRRNYRRKVALRNRILKEAYLREHPCVDCGETETIFLTFDHSRGEKRRNIADMIWHSSWRAILREIALCEVRCVKCHVKKTFRERQERREQAGMLT